MKLIQQDIDLEGTDLPSLEGLRSKGRTAFERIGLPTPKTEQWKYTRIRDLTDNEFVRAENHARACTHGCGCNHQKHLPFDAYEIVFCNGHLAHDHFHMPDGVELMSLLDAVRDHLTAPYLGKSFDLESFPFAALNTAYLEQGLFVRIGKGISLDKPLALIYHENGDTPYMAHMRNVFVLESDAEAELVEYAYHTGAPKAMYFHNIVNEIYIGRQARLNHYKLQNEAFKAVHIALNTVMVKENGRYESFCLQKGSNLARNETHVSLNGRGASTSVNAAYTMNGWATIDTTTDIEHKVSETISDQLIKGVVGGQAKGVFQGKIRIAPNAVKTQGYQLHRAMLLSDDAEVDVKPELEIYADDVKCSHGATCGDPDPEQLFYLRSRGLNEDEAKALLIQAFLNEVIDKISSASLHDWFAAQI
jgi:Fe-S cluster assembly protein SufD